jgi:hypothetical protein
MENSDIKIKIIQKIITTENLEILMDILDLLGPENSRLQINEPPEVYEKKIQAYVMNEWQKARIEIALKQVENEEVLTEEEAEIEMKKWFEKEEKLYGQ